MLRNLYDDKYNYNSNYDYIGVNIIQQKKEQQEKIKNNNSEKKTRTAKSYNNMERKRRSLLVMKELVNIHPGIKKNIVDIIKAHNLASKSVSPSSKRIFITNTAPKIIYKKTENNSKNYIKT